MAKRGRPVGSLSRHGSGLLKYLENRGHILPDEYLVSVYLDEDAPNVRAGQGSGSPHALLSQEAARGSRCDRDRQSGRRTARGNHQRQMQVPALINGTRRDQ